MDGSDARTLLSKMITQMGAEGVREALQKAGKEFDDDVVDRLVQQASGSDGITVETTSSGHIQHILDLVPELLIFFWGVLGRSSGSSQRNC